MDEAGEDAAGEQGSECSLYVSVLSAALKWGKRKRHRDGWFPGYLRGLHCIVWAGLELRMVLQPQPHK